MIGGYSKKIQHIFNIFFFIFSGLSTQVNASFQTGLSVERFQKAVLDPLGNMGDLKQ